jgi:hypothetical protein
VPIGSPIPREVRGISPIKHVFYVIRENRTYDQVLGDMSDGNGDPTLTIFGHTTPNAHALSQTFVLFDSFFVDAGVSPMATRTPRPRAQPTSSKKRGRRCTRAPAPRTWRRVAGISTSPTTNASMRGCRSSVSSSATARCHAARRERDVSRLVTTDDRQRRIWERLTGP